MITGAFTPNPTHLYQWRTQRAAHKDRDAVANGGNPTHHHTTLKIQPGRWTATPTTTPKTTETETQHAHLYRWNATPTHTGGTPPQTWDIPDKPDN